MTQLVQACVEGGLKHTSVANLGQRQDEVGMSTEVCSRVSRGKLIVLFLLFLVVDAAGMSAALTPLVSATQFFKDAVISQTSLVCIMLDKANKATQNRQGL